jgi:DNA-binding NarL/FixJ family response regulator
LCIDRQRGRASTLGSALAKLGYDVALATDGETDFAKVFTDPPDLVLYDVSTLRMGGLEACLGLLEELSQAGPRGAAVPFVLVMGDEPERDREFGLAGNRHTRPADRKPLDAPMNERPPQVESQTVSPPRKGPTDREKEVLTWVARGKTSAEIAIILGLKERTINFHCDNAMKRLDVINRTQAVAKAVAEGIIGI